MNIFRCIFVMSACALGAVLSVGSLAQAAVDHRHMSMPSAATMTEGEVKKVDMGASKVTIKHGEIKHLDMPGMTMAFPVKDKSLLTRAKPGDKIMFMVVNEGGKMLVTDIQPLR